MNYKSQVMIGAIFALFFVVTMNILASERDKKILLDTCNTPGEVCIKTGW